jgi:hypothetical protein
MFQEFSMGLAVGIWWRWFNFMLNSVE